MFLHISKPSITGIITSLTTMSGRLLWVSSIIAKTKRTIFQNETYNFLIFSHLALQSFERRLTTVLVAIKRLLSLH